jgi:hypothetical protein
LEIPRLVLPLVSSGGRTETILAGAFYEGNFGPELHIGSLQPVSIASGR